MKAMSAERQFPRNLYAGVDPIVLMPIAVADATFYTYETERHTQELGTAVQVVAKPAMVAAFEMAVDNGLPMQCKQRFAANFMLQTNRAVSFKVGFQTSRRGHQSGAEQNTASVERVAGNLFVGCVSTLGRVMKSLPCGDRRNTLASNMIHTLKRAGVRDYHAVPIASFPVIKDIQGGLYIPEPGDRVVSPNTLAIKYCFNKFDVSDSTAGSTSFQNVAVEEIFYVGRFNRPVSGTAIPHYVRARDYPAPVG